MRLHTLQIKFRCITAKPFCWMRNSRGRWSLRLGAISEDGGSISKISCFIGFKTSVKKIVPAITAIAASNNVSETNVKTVG